MAPYLEHKRPEAHSRLLVAAAAASPSRTWLGSPAAPREMIHQQRCAPAASSSASTYYRNLHHQPLGHHQHQHQHHNHHQQQQQHFGYQHQRHHGTSSSAATGVSAPASLRSNGRTAASRAQTSNAAGQSSNPAKQTTARSRSVQGPRQPEQQQQQQQQQPQQQQQQQQQQQSNNPRLQLNGAAFRASNEQLAAARAVPNVGSGSGASSAGSNPGSQDHLCDNSNDSGLGFEERQQQLIKAVQNAATPITKNQYRSASHMTSTNHDRWRSHCQEVRESNHTEPTTSYEWNGVNRGVCVEEKKKRRKMDIKLESEDANFAFPEGAQQQSEAKISTRNGIGSARGSGTVATGANVNGAVNRVVGVTRPRPHLGVVPKKPPPAHQGPITLTSQLNSLSRNGKTQLQIVCQPEQQHRARYQTEGSRGAVKDRTGNGFPIVRLIGYDKPTTLQVFIGTDLGRVAPHMFYQACRVSGKNSTPCIERKIDGTIVIEVEMEPVKDMLITCDCVGILKERNVDVEHRFPQEAVTLQGRSKKKSTRCRMVFRTTIAHDDGTNETLQVCSQPIVCTQPPGIPEICKKSLTACPCTGGLELFILGKNFLKDTRVVFQLDREDMSSALEGPWECTVVPDKEFLQQTHLVCVVPPYRRVNLLDAETVTVRLFAVSSGKTSEPHTFLYTAASTPPAPSVGKVESATGLGSPDGEVSLLTGKPPIIVPGSITSNGMHPPTAPVPSNFLGAIPPPTSITQTTVTPEILKSDPSPPPVTVSTPVTPVMMWTSQSSNSSVGPADVMMPPPANLVSNPLMSRRSSANLLILPDNLKTEILDENSQNSLMGENSMSGLPTASSVVTSPLEQLVNDNSRESSQSGLLRSTVPVNGSSPVQDSMLGVVDIIRNQQQLSIMPPQTNFGALHEPSQVKVLSPRTVNKDPGPAMTSEPSNLQGSPGVVDLRMKQHQPSEFNGIGNGNLGSFAATPPDQPLPAQSGHSIQKYLEQIETAPKKNDIVQDANFVRASIITSNQVSPLTTSLLTPNASAVPINELVNSAVESHQIVSPATSSPNTMLNSVGSVAEQEVIQASPQQNTNSPIPVKNMIMDALLPASSVSPMVVNGSTSPVAPGSISMSVSVPVPLPVQLPEPEDNLLKSISSALLPAIQESPIVTAAVAAIASSPNTTTHNPMQVSTDVIPGVASAINQALASDPVPLGVEQAVAVAQAQQEVQQVVAQVHQQAVHTVQQAQQQVVQQVVAHAQVVQQAVKKVQEVQQAPAAPAFQQAVTQASQEVVQQAIHQAQEEAKKQVHAVREAVQQAQAAQAIEAAVTQDLGHMLNQPAGFVVEASSALANNAHTDPGTINLTNAAEKAINEVITNATQDLINNRPFTTTTAEAIMATKNILNSVATQSAQLMNQTMEQLTSSATNPQNIVAIEQATQQASQSPPTAPIPMQTSTTPDTSQVVPLQQNPEPQSTVVSPIVQTVVESVAPGVMKKPEPQANGMMTQDLMTDHELLNYINSSCFDPQSGFLM